MNYLLLAWSQGNCAAKGEQRKSACPYPSGPMRAAWLKGFDAAPEDPQFTKRHMAKVRSDRRAAA